MTRKKNYSPDIIDSNETFNDDFAEIPVIEAEALKPETKVCNIIGIMPNVIHVNFNGYGIVVHTKNPEQYRSRNKIRVSYIGEIGKSGFKVWVN